MKRFHVHVHVDDLQKNISFYSAMFNAPPSRVEGDYAKWMLDEPRLAQTADLALLDEGKTSCCYAQSDKYWVTDPQGVAWEQFHTLGDIPLFDGGQVATCGTAARPQAGASSKAKSCCG